jgi:hypothetical protein
MDASQAQAAAVLSKSARLRFARQISLPEIGEHGQARLLASCVLRGTSEADAVAELYLERAGLHVSSNDTGVVTLSAPPSATEDFLRSLPGDARLAHAHAWLLGSLSAVETIKSVLNAHAKDETP